MDPILLSQPEHYSSGLQLLLDRWSLQKEKLQIFEENLKELNQSLTCKSIKENLEGNNFETVLLQNLSGLDNNIIDTSVQDKIFCLSSEQSMTSNDDDFGFNVHKKNNEGENIHKNNDESMEDFEKRIWKTVWNNEVLLNNDIVEGSYLHILEIDGTSSKNDLNRENSKIIRQFDAKFLKNDLQSAKNAKNKALRSSSVFQQDFEEQKARNLHFSLLPNHNFENMDPELRRQSSIQTCLKDVGMSHNLELIDHQIKTIDSNDLEILVQNKRFPLVRENVKLLEMDVNLVSPKLWSSSPRSEELSNLNELSNQRSNFIESIMASEAQRQMKREKEKLCRNEALKQEEEVVANMERILQSPLQLEHEEKQASIKEEEFLRQQRVEELRQELESSNAQLKNLTENWEILGKKIDLKTQSVEEYFKSQRLEEERKNLAAQRIIRAFKKKRCMMLNNCCIFIQKVVRGFFCRRKVQQLKGQRCKVMKVLATAIEKGNLSILIEYSKEAQNIGLHKELDMMKLEFAQRRIRHLHMSNETKYETFQSQPFPKFQILITEAKSIGLEEKTLRDLIESEAKSRDVALKHLNQVSKVGGWDEYEASMQRALSLGLKEHVDIIQEHWEVAKTKVSWWLQQMALSWRIESETIFEKVKEAQRLGLTTLAKEIQEIIAEKENHVLAGLEASTTNGTLRSFHEWLRLAKYFNLKENVIEYSARFRRKIVHVQKQLMQVTNTNYKVKRIKQLLLEGFRFGLETEMAIVVQHIRKQIIMFIMELVNYTKQSISKGDNILGKWKELHLRGKSVGIGVDILKDLLQSIERGIILEHTKIKRSIVAVFECDSMGFPINFDCEIRKAIINVKAVTLGYFPSNSEDHKVAKKQCLEVGYESITLKKVLPLISYSISWHEVDKLRGQWRHQYSQPFLTAFSSKSLVKISSEFAKLPQYTDKIKKDMQWQINNRQYYVREERNLDIEEEKAEAIILNNRNEDNNSDDEYWHTPKSPHLYGVQSLSPCILTRRILEESAHCNQTQLHRVIRLSLLHKDMTSLGVGILGRWCPNLQIFIMDENKLSMLKGAFRGCERSLEYVLIKDNLLNDFKGLESLQNLKALFLRGNFISYIGPNTEEYKKPKVADSMVGIKKTKTMMTTSRGSGYCLSMSSIPHALARSWEGTPRFREVKNDLRCCLTSRNSNEHPAHSLWPKLKKLYLGNNRIGHIWKLGSLCPNLEVLDLGSNELVTLGGSNGHAFMNLKKLHFLNVSQNKIKGGSLWEGLNHCPLLVSLMASRNRLTELPTHLGSVMLREIWLNGNSITSLACKSWLPNLQRFYLQDNLIDNLESLLGCPSLEILDISFNHVTELSQLSHLSSFRRLRTLQMNDNPISNQVEHVDKVLEVVPWLIELDNELVEDSSREKSVHSIFLKHMQVAGIQYLYENVARAEKPFFSYENPKDVARQWLNNNCSSFIDQYSLTSSTTFANQGENVKSKVVDRHNIKIMQDGKAKGIILWAILFRLHQMANANPILKAQLVSPRESNFHSLTSLPCHSIAKEKWNCLAFQEMFESHRKSHFWSKETNFQKEFFVQEEKFRQQYIEKEVGKDIIDTLEYHNVDQYLNDYIEHTDCKYQDIYKENVMYRMEIEDQLSRIRRLQALARGMLARKNNIKMQNLVVDALKAQEAQRLLEKLRFQNSILQIQAAWRGWMFKKVVNSTIKLQAFWRGFIAKKRYQKALSKLRYVDDDDFEYVAVDENEFVLNSLVFEDEYSLLCKLQASKENLCKSKTSSTNANLLVELVEEGNRPFLSKSHETCLFPNIGKQKGNMRVAALCENHSSIKNIQIECKQRQAEQSAALQNEDHIKLLKHSPQVTSQSQLQQFITKSSPKVKGHVCGKSLQAEKKKATVAEIAKEWGFKDEKTIESYMKARAKVQKMLEKKKAIHQGAQSRFELFKARFEEALAHSPSQHIHIKKTAPRLQCKVEKETIPIPCEGKIWTEETMDSWHPPTTLPTLIPHVQQKCLKKGKLRKSWPAWVPRSTRSIVMEI